jgi:hypothetical protein
MIGSDPELFLKNSEGKYISAIGLIGGSKDYPKPVKELGKGFFVQEDNVLLEFNTPPARSMNKWVQNHTSMLKYLNKFLESKGLKVSIDASADMPVDQLQDPRAHVFGCDPDFNVWTLQPNPRPHCDNPLFRSAGGHVHVAFKGSNVDKIILGRKLDLFLGLWSVTKDTDTQRKQLYGKAGAIRFKPYGIEYRVLSNFWLQSEDYLATVYDLVEQAKRYKGDPTPTVAEAINTNNKENARLLMSSLGRRWF